MDAFDMNLVLITFDIKNQSKVVPCIGKNSPYKTKSIPSCDDNWKGANPKVQFMYNGIQNQSLFLNSSVV